MSPAEPCLPSRTGKDFPLWPRSYCPWHVYNLYIIKWFIFNVHECPYFFAVWVTSSKCCLLVQANKAEITFRELLLENGTITIMKILISFVSRGSYCWGIKSNYLSCQALVWGVIEQKDWKLMRNTGSIELASMLKALAQMFRVFFLFFCLWR